LKKERERKYRYERGQWALKKIREEERERAELEAKEGESGVKDGRIWTIQCGEKGDKSKGSWERRSDARRAARDKAVKVITGTTKGLRTAHERGAISISRDKLWKSYNLREKWDIKMCGVWSAPYIADEVSSENEDPVGSGATATYIGRNDSGYHVVRACGHGVNPQHAKKVALESAKKFLRRLYEKDGTELDEIESEEVPTVEGDLPGDICFEVTGKGPER